MKKNEYIDVGKPKCQMTSCLECDICRTHKKEAGSQGMIIRDDVKALYGAEVMTYDFYFLTTSSRAV